MGDNWVFSLENNRTVKFYGFIVIGQNNLQFVMLDFRYGFMDALRK